MSSLINYPFSLRGLVCWTVSGNLWDVKYRLIYIRTALLPRRLIIYTWFRLRSLIKNVIHTPALRVDSKMVTTPQNSLLLSAAYSPVYNTGTTISILKQQQQYTLPTRVSLTKRSTASPSI